MLEGLEIIGAIVGVSVCAWAALYKLIEFLADKFDWYC